MFPKELQTIPIRSCSISDNDVERSVKLFLTNRFRRFVLFTAHRTVFKLFEPFSNWFALPHTQDDGCVTYTESQPFSRRNVKHGQSVWFHSTSLISNPLSEGILFSTDGPGLSKASYPNSISMQFRNWLRIEWKASIIKCVMGIQFNFVDRNVLINWFIGLNEWFFRRKFINKNVFPKEQFPLIQNLGILALSTHFYFWIFNERMVENLAAFVSTNNFNVLTWFWQFSSQNQSLSHSLLVFNLKAPEDKHQINRIQIAMKLIIHFICQFFRVKLSTVTKIITTARSFVCLFFFI